MKIKLIHPSSLDEFGKPRRYKKLNMLSMTLPLVAALTPDDVEVEIVYDAVEDINYDDKVDLVGITALTNLAPRAYQIAQEYRKRGVKVVMGGMHVTALPKEALLYADSVVVGEAEDIWPKLVADFQKTKKLEPVYKAESFPDLKKLVIPRYDLLKLDQYVRPPLSELPVINTFTTRGCPFNCSFCSVKKFFGGKYRLKPIENVIKEIEHYASKCDNVFFIDDNILGNKKYAEELFNALIPLNISWYSQFDSTALKEPELVELAGKSGCSEMLVGFETLNPENLRTVNKSFNKVETYKELINMLRDNGINPEATMMIGMDYDELDVVDRTADFLLENGVLDFRVSIVTPYPGTEFHRKLDEEGRIIERDWSKYDVNHAVFQPKNMNPEQLEECLWKIYDKTYSYMGIAKRMWKLRNNYFGKFKSKHSIKNDLTYQLYIHKVTKMRRDPVSDLPLDD